MPEILHRLTIAAKPESVHEAIATKAGVERWWTARPLEGEEKAGGTLRVFFGGADPSAVLDVVENASDRVVWRCVKGPADWIDTTITFATKLAQNGDTTLLFTHAGWREPSEFMHMCSTHWGSYLIGMKRGLEGGDFTPFPQGEVNRWP
jgi:uncharacterized protein YndB with AHSA1/START domain